MMIQTEILIKAPANRVWEILTDFNSFPQWNPFIVSIQVISGDLSSSSSSSSPATLKVILEPNGPSSQSIFTPKVVKWEPAKEFAWLGSIGGSSSTWAIFTGEHHFKLEEIILPEDGSVVTKFSHFENFGGWLAKPLLFFIGNQTKAGFQKMNIALKKRAEEQSSSS